MLGKLIYSALMSLDAYIADEKGNFDWAQPDRQVHTFINDLERRFGAYLFGRSMYEVMAVWDTDDWIKGMPEYIQDFASVWRAADKIVYSRSLESVSATRTRLERRLDGEAIRRLKASSDRDIAVGGPNLAAHAFRAGLVDECYIFAMPIAVGGGKSALPVGFSVAFDLVDQRRFDSGTVYLRYGVKTPSLPSEG